MQTSSGARRPPPITSSFSTQGGGQPSPPPPPSSNPFSSGMSRARVGHACDRCRTMRTKCSGGTRCSKCVKDDAVCVYGDRKRERNKKDLAESVERIQQLQDDNNALVSALRAVVSSPNFSAAGFEDVTNLLSIYNEDENWTSRTSTGSVSQTSSSQSHYFGTDSVPSSREGRGDSSHGKQSGGDQDRSRGGDRGEDRIASSVGSPGRQGELPKLVDLDKGMGASGFVGKVSEMSWIQRSREYLIKSPVYERDNAPAELDEHAKDAQTLTYFMDDMNLLSVDEDLVNAFHWPPYQTVLLLTEAYFHATQGAFQFLHREQFLSRLTAHAVHRSSPAPYQRWLAVANLVWAVGAKWLQLARLEGDNHESHLVYYARARALGLDHRVLFDHPDVDMVEGIGILSFYLFVNGSVTRAWNILGSSVRHATALGLHLKVTDSSIDEVDRERRARTWFSLYNLEVMIAETIGRPQSIQIAHITVPMDTVQHDSFQSPHTSGPDTSRISRELWIEHLQAAKDHGRSPIGVTIWSSITANNPTILSKCFSHYIRLCRISGKITDKLYTRGSESAWSITQECIRQLGRELRSWADKLPVDLRLTDNDTQHDPRVRFELAMYFQSVSMMLYRPCLCDIRIEDESALSRDFNTDTARACVNAAISMLEMTPDNPIAHEVTQLLPWWSLLHYVCQAGAVLLLELCLDCLHLQGKTATVLQAMRKAMSYLWCLSGQSLSAYRAWRIFLALLHEVCPRYGGMKVLNIREDAPKPEGWTDNAEASVMAVFS